MKYHEDNKRIFLCITAMMCQPTTDTPLKKTKSLFN